MMGKQGVLKCFNNACLEADIAVIEGVMGLYDGMGGNNDFASTAHVAKILDAPVLLVVDASKISRSIAAIVLGFLHFDRSVRIAGIVLNNVAGKRHAGYITDALASKIKAPVVGIINRNPKIKMEERHLGLIPTPELEHAKRKMVAAAAKSISDQLEIDRILDLCGKGHMLHDLSARTRIPTIARQLPLMNHSTFIMQTTSMRSKRAAQN